jgi:hypothetical protein
VLKLVLNVALASRRLRTSKGSRRSVRARNDLFSGPRVLLPREFPSRCRIERFKPVTRFRIAHAPGKNEGTGSLARKNGRNKNGRGPSADYADGRPRKCDWKKNGRGRKRPGAARQERERGTTNDQCPARWCRRLRKQAVFGDHVGIRPGRRSTRNRVKTIAPATLPGFYLV